MKGTVKFFDEKKGYGFIELDGENEEDHFVHRTEIQEGVSLDEGDRVEFESDLGDRGFQALSIRELE